ncbi:DNA-binding response regulator, partial [Pseudomonas syringae pv. spinaceae]
MQGQSGMSFAALLSSRSAAAAVATLACDKGPQPRVATHNNNSREMPLEPHTWHVLIVEDDLRLAELTSDYLQNNGLSVSIEGNGALAAARIIDE